MRVRAYEQTVEDERARIKAIESWHRWFAWFPVRGKVYVAEDGKKYQKILWLKKVWPEVVKYYDFNQTKNNLPAIISADKVNYLINKAKS